MVSGIANLTPEQIQILDMFFGISLKTISHNPTDLKSEDCNKLNKYLDLFEGLWNIQALKERHFDYWFTELRRIHATEVCVCCWVLWCNVIVSISSCVCVRMKRFVKN